MSSIDRELNSVWERLRGIRPHRENFLEEINVRNMRGIKNLRVPFDYPVTVIAGENACGKSTVLFGCAAAYKIPDENAKVNSPATLFPRFSESGSDNMEGIEIEYAYINHGQRMNMIWRRGKAWNRSFRGRKKATQPQRGMYLRTLANLTNPSEVRGMLQIKNHRSTTTHVSSEFLLLAHRVLNFSYQDIRKVEKNNRTGDLLLAELSEDKGSYSEFHMASGERSILRLSIEISKLENSLILIDEVETGLHPYIQKLLMLNLQKLALRQDLQIIVTTHSPVILDSVPLEGRIFLSRDKQSHDVHVEKPMRDILQKAMYGQSVDKLSIMCEDEIGKAIILGTVDALSMKMNFSPEHVFVGRNTGKAEFPNHAKTLEKIEKLSDFIFVMDGDARDMEEKMTSISTEVKLFFLPGNSCPEEWVWQEIKQNIEKYKSLLAISQLQEIVRNIEQELDGTVNPHEASKFKEYLRYLAEQSQQPTSYIARMVARYCVEKNEGTIIDFATELEDEIEKWRTI